MTPPRPVAIIHAPRWRRTTSPLDPMPDFPMPSRRLAIALVVLAASATACRSSGVRMAPQATPIAGTPVRQPDVERTALAARLATHARATESPIGLLAAAQMLIESGASSLTLPAQLTDSAGKESPAAAGRAITAEALIAQAEALGRENANVTALAAQLRQRAAAGARGAVGGARLGEYTVPAGAWHTFTIDFKAHEPAEVRVAGASGAAFECLVRNAGGREVARDRRGNDGCEMTWFPLEQGSFRILVHNRGALPATYLFTTN